MSQPAIKRRLPVGAEVQPSGGVHFRVWARKVSTVGVQLASSGGSSSGERFAELEPESGGYHSRYVAEAEESMLYRYRLANGSFPDPASRFQPGGVHGASQIINPHRFAWTDQQWGGVLREGHVLYEMHVGTFTPEGTWAAAARQLPELARLGVTVLEVMPVAEFAGNFGWGYDGVDLFAPTRLYGTPDDLRGFINHAHACGIGVILDVVYNHLGPDGNYLKEFSPEYVSKRHTSEWGEALNFDGEHCAAVREFVLANVEYWIDEFHFDGLRLDATQQLFDDSEDHITAAIARRARESGRGRAIYVIGENEPQDTRLLRRGDANGYGLDALWNDDLHRTATVAVTGRNPAYYTDYSGSPQEFISSAKWGFLYQGQRYKWQKQRRGTPGLDLDPACFITFLQNHDQLANSLNGVRLHALTDPGRFRAVTAYVLLAPQTPLLFQGQEFAASTPFLYFADHHPELATRIAEGRRKFLRQFPCLTLSETESILAPPDAEETFRKCKLDFSERQKHAHVYRLHCDLLALRRDDEVLRAVRRGEMDGAVLGSEAFVLRFFSRHGRDRLLIINLGRDLHLDPAPEPLLAPPAAAEWEMRWSSEDVIYGGGGTPPLDTEENWRIPGHAAVLLIATPEVNN